MVFRKKTEKEGAGESSGDPIIVEPEWARVCRGGFRSQSGRRTDRESETGEQFETVSGLLLLK